MTPKTQDAPSETVVDGVGPDDLNDPQPDIYDSPGQTVAYAIYHPDHGFAETCTSAIEDFTDHQNEGHAILLFRQRDVAAADRLQRGWSDEAQIIPVRILAPEVEAQVEAESTDSAVSETPPSQGEQEEPQRHKPFVRLDTAEEICSCVNNEIDMDLMDIIRGAEAMTRCIDEVIDFEDTKGVVRRERSILDYPRDDIGKVYAKTLGENIDFTCLGETYSGSELPDESTGYTGVIRGMLGMLAWRLDRIRRVTGAPHAARHMAEGNYWQGEVRGSTG